METDRSIALIDNTPCAQRFRQSAIGDPLWRCFPFNEHTNDQPPKVLPELYPGTIALVPAIAVLGPHWQHLQTRLPTTRIVYGPITDVQTALMYDITDFVTAPWEPPEIRLRSLLHAPQARLRSVGINVLGNTLTYGAATVQLRSLETRLLMYLVRSYDSVLPRRFLVEHHSPVADPTASRAVDMAISRLRRKLEVLFDGAGPVKIETIRGVGYRLSLAPVDNRWKSGNETVT